MARKTGRTPRFWNRRGHFGIGQGGAENNSLGITLSALIAMAAFLGIVGISLFSQEQEKRFKR
jgi:hypothetical protein